jgi:hypothetical protein
MPDGVQRGRRSLLTFPIRGGGGGGGDGTPYLVTVPGMAIKLGAAMCFVD